MSFVKSLDDISRIAEYKRFLEYGVFDPDFREKLKRDPRAAIREVGLHPEYMLDADGNKDTEAKKLYAAYVQEKLRMRDRVRDQSDPDSPEFSRWRKRQLARCAAAFHEEQSKGMVHSCLMFELSSGCSVGCEFCGLNSGPLTKVFRATEENQKLWEEILDAAESILGKAAGMGTCYYGTEPLDNPDYEFFMDSWQKRFGEYSQITTAVPLRNAERTHRILARLNPMGDIIFRFSVKSLEEFRQIVSEFTPEELLLVELLPQFEGAMDNHFAKVGRAAKDGDYQGSISCLSGILVNLCDRTMRLLTPISACPEFPEGQVEITRRNFATAEEFAAGLREMIDEMKTILSPNEELCLYDYLNFKFDDENRCMLYNTYGTGFRLDFSGPRQYLETTMNLLKEGGRTRREIAEAVLALDERLDPVSVYAMLNQFWNRGMIADEQIEEIRRQKQDPGTDRKGVHDGRKQKHGKSGVTGEENAGACPGTEGGACAGSGKPEETGRGLFSVLG